MLKFIALGLGVLVVVFVIVVARRPDTFRTTRSTVISAPPAVVFAQVNDLHQWQAWSPWAKMDPNAKNSFAGPAAGVGASFTWAGNKDVGEGTMTETESRPNDLVRFQLDFRKPFAGTNVAEFTFTPQGDQTAVSWSMSGKSNFVFKAMGLFMDCDKMVGDQFEKGLANLKSIAETEPKK